MIDFLEFTFRSFWTFLGVLILIAVPLNFLASVWNRFLNHLDVREHGYPPFQNNENTSNEEE